MFSSEYLQVLYIVVLELWVLLLQLDAIDNCQWLYVMLVKTKRYLTCKVCVCVSVER